MARLLSGIQFVSNMRWFSVHPGINSIGVAFSAPNKCLYLYRFMVLRSLVSVVRCVLMTMPADAGGMIVVSDEIISVNISISVTLFFIFFSS